MELNKKQYTQKHSQKGKKEREGEGDYLQHWGTCPSPIVFKTSPSSQAKPRVTDDLIACKPGHWAGNESADMFKIGSMIADVLGTLRSNIRPKVEPQRSYNSVWRTTGSILNVYEIII